MSGETFNPRSKLYSAPTEPLTGLPCRRFLFPRNLTLLAAVNDVLAYLSRDYVWTGSELEQLAIRNAIAQAIVSQTDCEDEDMPIGTISAFIGITPPTNWLICDGSTYQRADYPELYNVVSPDYQISETEFAVIDLQQRFIRGASSDYPVGSNGGDDHTGGGDDNVSNHTHHVTFPQFVEVNVELGSTPITVLDTTNEQSLTTDEAGNEDFDTLPVFTALHWIVRAK